jgi:hypothetical protein
MIRACALCACLCLASPSRGYVRTRADDGETPLAWAQTCIVLEPDGRGGIDVNAAELETALGRAIERWRRLIAPCSYIDLGYLEADRPRDFESTGQSVVGFVTRWDRDADAVAVTRPRIYGAPVDSGWLAAADIRLNQRDYGFSIQGGPPATGRASRSLEYTLAHEIGHVLGFGHSCWSNSADARLEDDQGVPLSHCDDLDPADPRSLSIMFPKDTGDSKRLPSEDDVRGVCELYPLDSRSVPPCYRTLQGGCAMSGARRPESLAALAFLALTACSLFARRRRIEASGFTKDRGSNS